MRSVSRAVLWLTVFTAVATLCAVIVVGALRSPVKGAVANFTATFSDVSGLFVGNDVRISGVQVGKVQALRLVGNAAEVDFTVLDDHPMYQNTVAAVRYQNLLGQRYLELVQPTTPGSRLPGGAAIPLAQTIPSFDVSKLFNGFRPLFHTLDPAQFNQLGENLLRLIQGDESGIGPALRDLDAISTYAVDRQSVFVVLIRNLGDISRDLGGKSRQLFDLITTLNGVLLRFTSKVEEFRTSIDQALPPLRNAINLLDTFERVFDGSTRPLYDLTSRMFPQTPTIIAGLSLVPTLIQGLRDTLSDDRPAVAPFTCSNGEVAIPGIGMVSFAQQDLVVCRP
jgi:phospholipid/cholesterol/gamma-HCH transport system substrate-binding protein